MNKETQDIIKRLQQAMKEQIPWEHPVYERTDGQSSMMKWQFDCYKLAREYLENLENKRLKTVHVREVYEDGNTTDIIVREHDNVGFTSIQDAAESYTRYLLERDMRQDNQSIESYNGCEWLVDVKQINDVKWTRFCVKAKVNMEFNVCIEDIIKVVV